MAIASIARRVLGGGRRRPAPRGGAPGPRPAGGAAGGSSTDAKVGRAARKGLRRFMR